VRVGEFFFLLRDDCYPPAKWLLGHIVEVHAARDGLVRVVTVKTTTNTFRRTRMYIEPRGTQGGWPYINNCNILEP
jgi:hypothetical protein